MKILVDVGISATTLPHRNEKLDYLILVFGASMLRMRRSSVKVKSYYLIGDSLLDIHPPAL